MKKLFFLTDLENIVFSKISDEFLSVTAIAGLCKEPRTSVYKALTNLEKVGLVQSKKIRNKNQHVYAMEAKDVLSQEMDKIKAAVLGDPESAPFATMLSSNISFQYIHGKKQLLETIYTMLSLESGERIYTMQPSGITKKWIEKMGEEEMVSIHEHLKKKGIIVVSLQGDKSPQEFGYSTDVVKSFKDRLSLSHLIPDEFLESSTALFVYRTSVFFVHVENMSGYILKDKHFSSLLKKVMSYSIQKSERARHLFSYDE